MRFPVVVPLAHRIELVLGEGEQRDAEVGENEVFRQKIESLEKLFRSLLRFRRKISEI